MEGELSDFLISLNREHMFKDNAVGLLWEAVPPLTEKLGAHRVTLIHKESTSCHKSHSRQSSLQKKRLLIQKPTHKQTKASWQQVKKADLATGRMRGKSHLNPNFFGGIWGVVFKTQREDGKKGISTTTKHKKQLWNKTVLNPYLTNSLEQFEVEMLW